MLWPICQFLPIRVSICGPSIHFSSFTAFSGSRCHRSFLCEHKGSLETLAVSNAISIQFIAKVSRLAAHFNSVVSRQRLGLRHLALMSGFKVAPHHYMQS
jgi:hypothetical protein